MVNQHTTTTKSHRVARSVLAAAVVVASVGAFVVWTRSPGMTGQSLALPASSTDEVERAVEHLDPGLVCASEDLRAALRFLRVSCIESSHTRDVDTLGSSTFESKDLLVLGCVPGITVQVYDREVTSDVSLIPVWRAAINKEWPTCPGGGTGRLRVWATNNVRVTSTHPALDATALSLLGEAPMEIGQKEGSAGAPSPTSPADERVPTPTSGDANVALLPGLGKCFWPKSGDVIVKPSETAIGCNGTFLLEDLRWDSWDSQQAEGVGVINEVDLRPGDSNASAPRKRSSVKVVADSPVTVACGLFFSRLELTYLSGDRDGKVEVLDDMAPSNYNCD